MIPLDDLVWENELAAGVVLLLLWKSYKKINDRTYFDV